VDKEGITRRFTEINVSEMVMLGSKSPSDTATASGTQVEAPPVIHAGAEDDDLPF
jgi:hypothetical protein